MSGKNRTREFSPKILLFNLKAAFLVYLDMISVDRLSFAYLNIKTVRVDSLNDVKKQSVEAN